MHLIHSEYSVPSTLPLTAGMFTAQPKIEISVLLRLLVAIHPSASCEAAIQSVYHQTSC